MHTFEMNDLNVHYCKTTSVKRLSAYQNIGIGQGVHISRPKGKKNYSNIWQWRQCLVIFTQQKEYFGAILSLETDLVFMVTYFFCEPLGENGREYRKLVLISNNYTEVSDENEPFPSFSMILKVLCTKMSELCREIHY